MKMLFSIIPLSILVLRIPYWKRAIINFKMQIHPIQFLMLNPAPYLMALKNPFDNKCFSADVDTFVKLLNGAKTQKIYVLVEYRKELGWFNYEEVYGKKQEFKISSHSEMRCWGNIREKNKTYLSTRLPER